MVSSNPKWSQLGVSFVLAWVILVPLGQSIPINVVRNLISPTPNALINYLLTFNSSALVGLGIGLVQWYLLRAWQYKNAWWIPATSLGWALGTMIDLATMPLFARSSPFFIVLSRVMLISWPGIIVSIPQWVVLRRNVSFSAIWILINAFAWIAPSYLLGINNDSSTILLIPTIAYAMTGIGIAWLMRRPLLR